MEINGPICRASKVETLNPLDAVGFYISVHVGHPIYRSRIAVHKNIRVGVINVRFDNRIVAAALDDVVQLSIRYITTGPRARCGIGHGESLISCKGTKGPRAGCVTHTKASAVTEGANH